MRRSKIILLLCAGFLAGAGSMIALVAIFFETRPANHPLRVPERWGIREGEMGRLIVCPRSAPRLLVEIKCSPDMARLESIAVAKEGPGNIFKYDVEGIFGVPMAEYCGGGADNWISWTDLNADGVFDRRIVLKDHIMEIWQDGRWLPAVGPGKRVETKQGEYEFAPLVGAWRPVTHKTGGADR